MRPFKTILLILLLFVLSKGEHLPVKIYTSADGLGTSASFNMVRDARGFLWICSRDGLIRFDGYRFITYRIGDDNAEPSVFDLIPTREGIYWINLNRGRDYRFVPKSETTLLEAVQQHAAKNDYRVTLNVEPLLEGPMPIKQDKEGNLWTANNLGIYIMRETNGKMDSQFIPLKLPGNPKKDLSRIEMSDGQGNSLWIGTSWGLVRRFPDGKLIHYTLQPQNDVDMILNLAEDKEKRVWMVRPDGLMVLKIDENEDSSKLESFTARKAVVKKGVVDSNGRPQFPEQPGEAFTFSFADILSRDAEESLKGKSASKPELYRLICASDGRIWVTSNHGLILFDGKRFQQYTTRHGLASNSIDSIVEDNEGHLWVTSYGGLHRINPNGLTAFDETDGFEKARVHSIYEDRNGELQVVSGNFSISSFHDNAFKMVRPRIPQDSIWTWQSNAAYLDSHGDWWVNTTAAVYRFTGINRIEDLANKEPTNVFNSKNGLISDNNFRVFEDSKGDVWISTNTGGRQGLTRWQRATGTFQQFFKEDGLPDTATACSFAEDKDGNLWFGFIEGGIARFRNGRFTSLSKDDGLQEGTVTSLYNDRSGRMWIATSRNGLSRVDDPTAERPTFKRYTIADGLTSNNIRCITEDLYGNIYLGTVRGVNRLSPGTGRVKYYGTSDGLASDFVSVAYRDRNGAVWFGTFNGISRLIPEPDKPLQPPAILISGLRIAGVDYSISPLGQSEAFVPDQSANRNNLQIDFLSINTGGDASTRYQYKLEGVDTEWSQPTAERAVTLANLSPGTYRFLVRAINADDVVSPQPAFVSFTVLRPIYQQWWFIAAVVLLIGLAVYAIYRYRLRRLVELEKVRTRIATDLHDDIGSSLSQIAILSEVVRQKVGDNGANEPLDLIANTSREMVDSMSDIVWAINPQKDHLSDLVHRMRRFAEDMLDTQDIDYKFNIQESGMDVSLGADLRREIYLIFKECINNLVKHAGATNVDIDVRLKKDSLIINIIDNGCGFDVAETTNGNHIGYGGNGLPNMKRRAESFGGKFIIASVKGEGTNIHLEAPVGQKNILAVFKT